MIHSITAGGSLLIFGSSHSARRRVLLRGRAGASRGTGARRDRLPSDRRHRRTVAPPRARDLRDRPRRGVPRRERRSDRNRNGRIVQPRDRQRSPRFGASSRPRPARLARTAARRTQRRRPSVVRAATRSSRNPRSGSGRPSRFYSPTSSTRQGWASGSILRRSRTSRDSQDGPLVGEGEGSPSRSRSCAGATRAAGSHRR
jgi:hypothetical protein